jgi:hypothetical protein
MSMSFWLTKLFNKRRARTIRNLPKPLPKKTMLGLERMEDKLAPANLNISGGALTFTDGGTQNNNLTVGVAAGVYSFNDSLSVITLDAGAITAGWKGSGTNTVSGPAASVTGSITINLGGGTNTVNLRSTNNATTINGQTGNSTVYISSNAPSNTGNLALITADVTVAAGTATSLWAADYTGAGVSRVIDITSTGISGLGANAINYTGTLNSLRVTGSNAAGYAETYNITAAPAKSLTVDGNAGVDTFNVNSTLGVATINAGAGDDVVTVLAGGAGLYSERGRWHRFELADDRRHCRCLRNLGRRRRPHFDHWHRRCHR